ncbi:MAG TPA: aldo/keto reductase [Planctomycetota bacterium]
MFLKAAAAGALGAVMASKSSYAAEEATALVALGKRLKCSRIGAGTGMRGWQRESNHTRMGKAKFEALLNYEYDQGIRFYDCADLYGTHEIVGGFLKGKPRDSYVVSTKIWFKPDGIPEGDRPDADVCVKRFLKELQTECIDLVQLHAVESAQWNEEERKQMDLLAKLKEQGLIKAHGVTCHSLPALKTAAAEPWVDVIHARINPFQMHMDATPEEVVPVLKAARKAGKGVIGMKINGQGDCSASQLSESIKFALSCGAVDCMIAGFETNEQIDVFKKLVTEHLNGK